MPRPCRFIADRAKDKARLKIEISGTRFSAQNAYDLPGFQALIGMDVDTLKRFARLIREGLFSPLLILFFLSRQKALIISDVKRWVAVEYLEGTDRSHVKNFLSLIAQYPEFRNVFYFRLFKGSFLEVVAAYLTRVIYRESSALILCKSSNIGPGLFIQHGFSTMVNADIGVNCWINQQVSIGYKDRSGRPALGNNVTVSVGAKVLGHIKLGDNVIVGANALVIKDVPDNCVVGGVPAVIIKKTA